MPQSRKWQLTINNPLDKGFTHEHIKEELESMSGMLYWCLCDEIGEEETPHTHVYLVLRTPRPHTTIGNRFPGAHRELAKGTSQQNRDYVLKDGEQYNKQPDGRYDYVDSSNKRHVGTNFSDTFEEWGEMPAEQQGKSKAVDQMYSLLKDGASNLEIVDAVPSAMLRIQDIERTRSMLRDSQFANAWRELQVSYIWGNTGVGFALALLLLLPVSMFSFAPRAKAVAVVDDVAIFGLLYLAANGYNVNVANANSDAIISSFHSLWNDFKNDDSDEFIYNDNLLSAAWLVVTADNALRVDKAVASLFSDFASWVKGKAQAAPEQTLPLVSCKVVFVNGEPITLTSYPWMIGSPPAHAL